MEKVTEATLHLEKVTEATLHMAKCSLSLEYLKVTEAMAKCNLSLNYSQKIFWSDWTSVEKVCNVGNDELANYNFFLAQNGIAISVKKFPMNPIPPFTMHQIPDIIPNTERWG